MRRSLGRPLADRAVHRRRSRRGGTGPVIVTECHVSAAGANGKGRAETGGPGGPPPQPYGLPGAGEGIAYFEDNQDDVRLTVTAKLVVRVTRPEILR